MPELKFDNRTESPLWKCGDFSTPLFRYKIPFKFKMIAFFCRLFRIKFEVKTQILVDGKPIKKNLFGLTKKCWGAK